MSKLPELHSSHPSFLRNHLFVWQKQKAKCVDIQRGPLLQGGGVRSAATGGGSETKSVTTYIKTICRTLFFSSPVATLPSSLPPRASPPLARLCRFRSIAEKEPLLPEGGDNRQTSSREQNLFYVFAAVRAEFWQKT